MRRQIFVHLFIAWLLLAVSALNHVTANVQAIQPVDFKLRKLQATPKPHGEDVIPSWVTEKKTRKSPSGPNPIGNHRPPTKP
ncbi:hypothetical protein L195_g008948 [Trifolium pratense]|uniref:CLAVATA3/ESR (CLE)-related protein 46-like n=1 Tax=Trifolium pratense TaxID=57577 RepID=A0A2K3NVV1_TRIPR|nr:CLAVATA3/ESR (CLE)-related protein 46-like [Trifolium pratense]PNY12319.1 hypothetical protein L195_g008948 [Trifolium pratense]